MTDSKRTYQSVIYVSADMLTIQPVTPRQTRPKQQPNQISKPQMGESSRGGFSPDVIQRIIDRLKEK
jgi:hypothetical protein